MYRTGHYGVSLLLYAPVGFALLVAGYPAVCLLGGAAMLALAPLPDYDLRVPFVEHRGPTHTLAFALLVGTVLGGASYVSAPTLGLDPRVAGATGVFVGTYGIVAHLVGDVLTPAGIAPFWPVSSRNYSLSVTRADSTVANTALLALGVFLTVVAAVVGGRVG
ncbi:metal-dependent hydrolase [Haloarchaeobius sp. FL176]|uniref:metal-dependent hydrolase n=1 Tax=Haloarchaeobius sp. FL176 TaxID=2967129 RepID=UPI00214732C1|nr:metal-dependent hydrolase [Haloarchaeobius sp. FL176]